MTNIKFVEEEFVGGYYNYPTPCPYKQENRYQHRIIGVGSTPCERCDCFIERKENIVKCNYVSILQKEKNSQKRQGRR